MEDYRIELKETFEKTCQLLKQERDIAIKCLHLIGRLYESNAAVNLCIPDRQYFAKLGLSKDQYYKRAQAAKVIGRFPNMAKMFERGEVGVTVLSMMAPKITQTNCEVIEKSIFGKSKREVGYFLKKLNFDGTVKDFEASSELTIILSESEHKILDRARDVMAAKGKVPTNAELLVQACKDLLEKRDPLQKAERAAKRQSRKNSVCAGAKILPNKAAASEEDKRSNLAPVQKVNRMSSLKRGSIPKSIVHQLWKRSRGKCEFSYPGGSDCEETMMLEIDHIDPWCRGGTHNFKNLRILCRKHNRYEADKLLGKAWMKGKVESERIPNS